MTYYQNPYNYNFGYYPQAQTIQPIQPIVVQPPMANPQQQAVEQNYNVQPVQTNPTTNESYFIWVQGEAGAKSYPVARGTTVPLFDSEGDFVYIKSVDQNGVPLPLITKALSDVPVIVEEKADDNKKQDIDLSNYVTKEQYEELSNRILELETKPSSPTYTSTFTGNTFNNSRKGKDDGGKYTV